jgi:hypothetical protein
MARLIELRYHDVFTGKENLDQEIRTQESTQSLPRNPDGYERPFCFWPLTLRVDSFYATESAIAESF